MSECRYYPVDKMLALARMRFVVGLYSVLLLLWLSVWETLQCSQAYMFSRKYLNRQIYKERSICPGFGTPLAVPPIAS